VCAVYCGRALGFAVVITGSCHGISFCRVDPLQSDLFQPGSPTGNATPGTKVITGHRTHGLEDFNLGIRCNPDSSSAGSDAIFNLAAENRRESSERGMNSMKNMLLQLKVWKDLRGQDLIEYSLMAGFVAVAVGATMPDIAMSLSQIFSKVTSTLSQANAS
jgi:Flp pilus assembly pilin Flp